VTVIVGLIEHNTTYIGGDAALTNINSGSIALCAEPKVFFRGDYLFGWSGPVRMQNILQHICPEPERKPEGISLSQHLTVSWIDVLRRVFKEQGLAEIDRNREHTPNSFMVGYKGELCVVDDIYAVIQLKRNYDVLGSGMFLAEGALSYALGYTPRLHPETKVRRALAVAAAGNAYVAPPFTILST